MKRILALFLAFAFTVTTFADRQQATPTDVFTEKAMQDDLLQMLADFATYMKADFQPCAEPNGLGEECGCFKGENTMGSD